MPFFNFFIQLREILTLAFCIIASILLIIFNDNDPGYPFRKVAFNTIGEVGKIVQESTAYFRLTKKVEKLREENAKLSYEISQLEDALLENIRLKKLLNFKEKTDFDLIPAEVIGQNPLSILNGFLLNVGELSGVNKFDAVITAEGLVGKITEVGKEFSICQILLDRNSKVSAKIQRNRESGIIAWDGGAQLNLLYIAKTIKVLIGDVIMTSGYSQIFPENIKIGIVINVSLDTDNLFQEITVQPSVNFSQIEEVFILKSGESVAKQ